MVFPSFKRMFIKYNVQKQLIVFLNLQNGHQLDFISKGSGDTINCLFNLNYFLHPNEELKEVECILGDQSLQIKDMILSKREFSAKILQGSPDTISTFMCKVTTKTNHIQEFIVLIAIADQARLQKDLHQKQRENVLWIASQDPGPEYKQENGKEWIEGDMVVNAESYCVWRCHHNHGTIEWYPLLSLSEIAQPVTMSWFKGSSESQAEDVLDQICSDKGKIKSDGNGGLIVDGDLYSNKFHTHSIVSGNPMGNGVFFSTPGLLSGQSLYVASPEAQPRNMYVGLNGVVSTKMLSADYLQLALLSVAELPTTVKKGTLILCHDYQDIPMPILLCALRDDPQSVEDWQAVSYDKNLSSQPEMEDSPKLLESSNNAHLSPLDIHGVMADNVVKMPSAFLSKQKTDDFSEIVNSDETISDKRISYQTYTHIDFDNFVLPPSEGRSVSWNKLHPQIKNNKIKGAGQNCWQFDGDYWHVPMDGLLHVQGWFIFTEEEMKLSDPISYHAGDLLFLNIGCNLDQDIQNEIVTQLEFSLLPYVNDVTHCICANQRLPFTLSYPVSKEDKISFELAYIQQRTTYSQNKELQVKKAVFQLYMT